MKKVTLDVEQPADAAALAPLLSTLPLELRPDMESFIHACYEVIVCACHSHKLQIGMYSLCSATCSAHHRTCW